MGESVPLRPLRRQAIFERVAAAVHEYIRTNGMQPGEKLPSERELAAALNVGRSSIREAIATLRANGMVEARHGEGLFLRRLSPEPIRLAVTDSHETSLELPYIWETRQALESQCARIAAARATDDDLAELDAALEVMADEISRGLPGLEGDRRFHVGVARASHNPILLALLDGVREALDRTSSRSLGRTGQPEMSLADHRRILAAIRAHEPADAGNAMLSHLVGTTDSSVLLHSHTGRNA